MKVPRTNHRQTGVAALEFALVSALFFTVLIGVMEMGRLLWTWNAAAEATRFGARVAVVCETGRASGIKNLMIGRLPTLTSDHIEIIYSGTAVQVQLKGYTHKTIIPFIPLSIALPSFSTTLPKEYMDESGSNPVCP